MSNGALLFKQEALNISETFPVLQYLESEAGEPCIVGELILQADQDLFVDSYSIRIESTSGYPFQFPHVFETGGRIPVNIDWHVFSDGHCCIMSVPEEALLCKQAITLQWFIEQQVKPYFFNQKHREIHGFFTNERSHGLKGNIEFFEEIFTSKDLNLIAKGLLLINGRKEPNRVSKCFCGSGLKYRNCHREAYRTLVSFLDEELDFYVRMIIASPRFSF